MKIDYHCGRFKKIKVLEVFLFFFFAISFLLLSDWWRVEAEIANLRLRSEWLNVNNELLHSSECRPGAASIILPAGASDGRKRGNLVKPA